MDTGNKILEATEQLCSSFLPQKITLDMIAAKAKVGKGTIYSYFIDKEDLFQKLALSLIEKLRVEMMDTALSSRGSSIERLENLGEVYHSFIGEHPMIIAIAIFLREAPPWLDTGEENEFFRIELVLVTMIESLVKLGIEEGLLRSDVDTKTLAHFILGVFRSKGPMLHKKERVPSKTIRDLILNGAGVH